MGVGGEGGRGQLLPFEDPVTIKIATALHFVCLSHPPACPPPRDQIPTRPIGCFTKTLRYIAESPLFVTFEAGTCQSH